MFIHLANSPFVAYDATYAREDCQVAYDQASQHRTCRCHGAIFAPTNQAAVPWRPANIPLTQVVANVNNKTGNRTFAS